jgi:hypothetical protein
MDALSKAEALTAYKEMLLDEVCQGSLEESDIQPLMFKKQVALGIELSKPERVKRPPRINMGIHGKPRPSMSLFVSQGTRMASQGKRARWQHAR